MAFGAAASIDERSNSLWVVTNDKLLKDIESLVDAMEKQAKTSSRTVNARLWDGSRRPA